MQIHQKKYVGVWMDHAIANVMVYVADHITTTRIVNEFTHQQKEESLSKSEKLMHHKEQQDQAAFYEAITTQIQDFSEILLFGPTNAKSELANLLKANHRFDDTMIIIETTDKLNEHQQVASVTKHFSNPKQLHQKSDGNNA